MFYKLEIEQIKLHCVYGSQACISKLPLRVECFFFYKLKHHLETSDVILILIYSEFQIMHVLPFPKIAV